MVGYGTNRGTVHLVASWGRHNKTVQMDNNRWLSCKRMPLAPLGFVQKERICISAVPRLTCTRSFGPELQEPKFRFRRRQACLLRTDLGGCFIFFTEPIDNSPFIGWSLQSPNRVRAVKTTPNARRKFTVEILRLRKSPQYLEKRTACGPDIDHAAPERRGSWPPLEWS